MWKSNVAIWIPVAGNASLQSIPARQRHVHQTGWRRKNTWVVVVRFLTCLLKETLAKVARRWRLSKIWWTIIVALLLVSISRKFCPQKQTLAFQVFKGRLKSVNDSSILVARKARMLKSALSSSASKSEFVVRFGDSDLVGGSSSSDEKDRTCHCLSINELVDSDGISNNNNNNNLLIMAKENSNGELIARLMIRWKPHDKVTTTKNS